MFFWYLIKISIKLEGEIVMQNDIAFIIAGMKHFQQKGYKGKYIGVSLNETSGDIREIESEKLTWNIAYFDPAGNIREVRWNDSYEAYTSIYQSKDPDN